MPLLEQKLPNTATGYALWHITEEEDNLVRALQPFPVQWERLAAIKAPKRRLEWLACRLALFQLLQASGLNTTGLLYNLPQGSPCLHDCPYGISLSHSFPYAAAALHLKHTPGIDIEHASDKVWRIRHKFLSEPELSHTGEDLHALCLYWAAKEALYKHLGESGVIFNRELKIAPFSLQKEGTIDARIERPHVIKDVSLQYYRRQNLIICHTA